MEISKEELQAAEEAIHRYTDRLVKHLKTNHLDPSKPDLPGLPVSTCHECMNCAQGIQSNRRVIEEFG